MELSTASLYEPKRRARSRTIIEQPPYTVVSLRLHTDGTLYQTRSNEECVDSHQTWYVRNKRDNKSSGHNGDSKWDGPG